MKSYVCLLLWVGRYLIIALCVSASSTALTAQELEYSDRTRAVDIAESGAEKVAEQMVSLSGNRIIAILQQEPGLLLEIKKLLVRKAYEQGRVVGPKELSDEVLFQLIEKDETIRVLITQEIEERGYVQVRPKLKDTERRHTALQADMRNYPAASENDTRKSGNDLNTQQGTTPSSAPSAPAPTTPPAKPEFPQNTDPRRLLEQARGMTDTLGGFPLNVLGMQSIDPDQLGALLSSHLGNANPSLFSVANTRVSSDKVTGALAALGGSPLTATDQPQPPASALSAQNNAKPEATPKRAFRENRAMLFHRANPYANVPSLYDLYFQYPGTSVPPERFGADIFRSGTGNSNQLPMDLPAGPDYVVGPGDALGIDLWGSVSQRLNRVVDRDGRLILPEVGPVQVSGHTLGDVQHLVQTVLRTQVRDIQADVSLSQFRTIRVYVVGDVERPGAYDISSLSTPLNALYEAGGPTSQGSLRLLKHYRGEQLIQDVDIYELLLRGVRSNMERLQSGDTILVPPVGPEITVEGMVRRPAIYELKAETNLAEALQLAGGILPTGSVRHVTVERIVAHESRTLLQVDVPENNNDVSTTKALEGFKIQDGDHVRISPIVAFSEKTVYLDGHVFRPGKYAYRDGMRVADLIKSYNELLPEPYGRHAEIIRLNPPDYSPVVLSFNLENALVGKEQNLLLKPFDTVRVFGRFDFEDPPVITVTGEVRDPGDHVTNGATYLRDAIYLAGNATPEAQLEDAQVFRRTSDGKLRIISVNLRKALAGEAAQNILLEPKDRVFIHKNAAKVDPPTVSIEGEVLHPGKYPLAEDMTAADLVRIAGGLKRSAFAKEADLTTYAVEQGSQIVSEHTTVPIARALANEPDTDVRLHDGDVLTIRQLSGWNNVGATILVEGEVVHPGTYGIEEGERLSSILVRSGGFRADAYPYGAIFERAQVRELEEKSRAELIRRVQAEGPGTKSILDLDPTYKDSAQFQWKNTLEKLQSTAPTGRVVIHISTNLKRWATTTSDIQVRAGDSIYIPKRPNVVMVDGAVYNSTAVTFKPGKDAGWYLRQAGGPTNMADRKRIFVIRADGSVVDGGGMFRGGVLSAALRPGDTLVVPDKAVGGGFSWRTTLQVAQLVSAVGIAVQVARGF